MSAPPDRIISDRVVPVVLAGGQGRRLWPLSRPSRPKPFLRMPGGLSLLQRTLNRASAYGQPSIICEARHRNLILGDLRNADMQADPLFLEPVGRGTAAAVAVAAHYFHRDDPLLLVMPSDHAILKPDLLREAVLQGITAARQGHMVLFGIPPGRAASCFGYIRQGQELGPGVFDVSQFVEKPDKIRAQQFLHEGGWLWNSGIFLFSAVAFLDVLKGLAPDLHEGSYQAVARARRFQTSVFIDEKSFLCCPVQPVDRAVMERAPRRVVLPVDPGWSDLGSWPALAAHLLNPNRRLAA